MNFQQLRIVRETVRQNFNLTDVANTLFTSQSGVSKNIKDLEDELGVDLFIRKGKRILGLTEPGQDLIVVFERILLDLNNIKRQAKSYRTGDRGQLTLATTHTQARYALPSVITEFKQTFPNVHLSLHQLSPKEIVASLLAGEADIGIATEALGNNSELISFPYYPWHHAVIVPKDHILESIKPLTLKALAEFPIITYHEGFTGRTNIDQQFENEGLSPDIVLSALDADVIKTYVELGLGVGIIASMAFDAKRDSNLSLLRTEHLFQTNVTHIAVRRGHFLHKFAYRFIELCSKNLNENYIRERIAPSFELE
ncbi:MAG: CysB family HTH-type transcriptional regulator [Pseudomonadota bacterium]